MLCARLNSPISRPYLRVEPFNRYGFDCSRPEKPEQRCHRAQKQRVHVGIEILPTASREKPNTRRGHALEYRLAKIELAFRRRPSCGSSKNTEERGQPEPCVIPCLFHSHHQRLTM